MGWMDERGSPGLCRAYDLFVFFEAEKGRGEIEVERQDEGGEVYVELTRNSLQPGGQRGLVPTRHGAKSLVSDAEEHNGEEGEDEGCGGADVPLAEDDAEVGRVPGEEHLKRRPVQSINRSLREPGNELGWIMDQGQ